MLKYRPSKNPVIWFICSPNPKVQLKNVEEPVENKRLLLKNKCVKPWLIFLLNISTTFPELRGWHRSDKVHASLAKLLEEGVVFRDLYGETLRVENQLTDGSWSVLQTALDTTAVVVRKSAADGLEGVLKIEICGDLNSGVWVMSWSTNWPHCITWWVSSSEGESTSGTTLILTSLAEGRLRSPPPVTELVFPFQTPSLYSGRRIRWKAVLAAEQKTINCIVSFPSKYHYIMLH